MIIERNSTGICHEVTLLGDTVYLACNPGLIVGLRRGSVVFMIGDYSYFEEAEDRIVNCSKCVRMRK